MNYECMHTRCENSQVALKYSDAFCEMNFFVSTVFIVHTSNIQNYVYHTLVESTY